MTTILAGIRRDAGWKRAAMVLTAAGVVVLTAASASAQIAPGQSGSSTTMVFTDNGEAFRTLNAFAACYARQNTTRALELIATEPATREEAPTYRRLFSRDNMSCLGEDTELRMPVAMVRGRSPRACTRGGIALPPNLAQAAPAPGEVRTLSEAARCYTATHREQVRALVEQTAAGSRREFEALGEIAGDLFQCVPETARGRRFDPTQVRFRLAEALLRLPAPSD